MALLYRQIHPHHVRDDGGVSSQAFDPMRGGGREGAERRELSVYNGDLIGPSDAFRHHTEQLNLNSVGVLTVDEDECRALQVDVIHDGIGFPEHSTLSFAGLSRRRILFVARELRDLAVARGRQYGPVNVRTG